MQRRKIGNSDSADLSAVDSIPVISKVGVLKLMVLASVGILEIGTVDNLKLLGRSLLLGLSFSIFLAAMLCLTP